MNYKPIIRSYEAGLELADKINYPAILSASFVLRGWTRIANNQNEFRELLKQGLALSPISEVRIYWKDA